MDFITLLLFAVGLCFDSFAVSLSCGMSCCACTRRRMFRFAAILGLCQGLTPLAGWAVATNFRTVIEAYDHWIAFVLLLFLGGKMIWESCGEEDGEHLKGNPFALGRNVMLGIATSIDALVAGIAMALLPLTIVPSDSQLLNMLAAVFIIALVTLVSSLTGLYLGRRSRGKLGERAELIGGIILILIGIKVLAEHLSEV
ncbi:manganese efflux pump MntP family protein [Rikenella microfusus]|uniref:Putative manganese efflux pump MntP n=1 Tax=Rikenella microfusus TaxID=28139 RepID=A0A379MR92_9BACT|nr:manganese efflux pump MntP family protein [Rikenella microfusus]SUE34171.1 putative sporulation protein YtaF [Rikenella microfusus]HJE88824.1 manganese efflux pump MntP family protein [Rikenella microfusus]